jgi:predicted deacetylase
MPARGGPAAGKARSLLISLHDVTPFHLERIRRAEDLYRELGLAKVAYLFVPEYHGGHPSAGDPAFAEWCRKERPFRVQWHLHGWHHLETPEPGAPAGGAGDALKRRLLTAGEGEFLALSPEGQRRRLDAGLSAFRACLGADPEGFVAPAWLFNAHLLPLLKEKGIRHTEDHRRLYRADTGAALPSPVITWATRTAVRKYGSLVVCPLLARVFGGSPCLRVAMHPFDFDHPATVRSIRAVLEYLRPGREQVFPTDLDFDRSGPA